jgi:hypothetical protein
MQKPPSEKQAETTPPKGSTRDKELIEAAERVYRKYGSDLSAFYRHAQKERELEKRG